MESQAKVRVIFRAKTQANIFLLNWAPESDAKKPAKKLRRSNSANTRLGLTVILHADEPNYEVAENNFYGFKVRKQNLYRPDK